MDQNHKQTGSDRKLRPSHWSPAGTWSLCRPIGCERRVGSEVVVHAEAAPPAAGLWGSAGQQGVGAPRPLLHQDVPQAPELLPQLRLTHEVRGEDGRRSSRLLQVHEAQGVQSQAGGPQGAGGEGVRQSGTQQGLEVQGGGGGGGGGGEAMEASLKLQLLRAGTHLLFMNNVSNKRGYSQLFLLSYCNYCHIITIKNNNNSFLLDNVIIL